MCPTMGRGYRNKKRQGTGTLRRGRGAGKDGWGRSRVGEEEEKAGKGVRCGIGT